MNEVENSNSNSNLWISLMTKNYVAEQHSKSILVFGPKQSGKGTILKNLFGTQSYPYSFTIVDREERKMIEIYSTYEDIIPKLKPDLIVIVLDISKPSSIVSELEKYMGLVEKNYKFSMKDHEVENTNYKVLYNEIPMLVIGNKSDNIHLLEKSKGEAYIDFIQQSLRSILLHYHCSLIYANQFREESQNLLKSIIFEILFEDKASNKLEPQVIEKDIIYVPALWDSPGKISLLGKFDVSLFDINVNGWDKVNTNYLQTVGGEKENIEVTPNVIVKEQEFLGSLLDKIPQSSTTSEDFTSYESNPVLSPKKEPSGSQQIANFFQSFLNNKGTGSNLRAAVEAELDKIRNK